MPRLSAPAAPAIWGASRPLFLVSSRDTWQVIGVSSSHCFCDVLSMNRATCQQPQADAEVEQRPSSLNYAYPPLVVGTAAESAAPPVAPNQILSPQGTEAMAMFVGRTRGNLKVTQPMAYGEWSTAYGSKRLRGGSRWVTADGGRCTDCGPWPTADGLWRKKGPVTYGVPSRAALQCVADGKGACSRRCVLSGS